jgi:two-component system OmpR family sensor kinase
MLHVLRTTLSGIRARVVLWYLGLLAISLIVAVLALRQFLIVGLDESVGEGLTQEAEELRLLTKGNDPATGKPFNDDVEAIFDTFLSRNVPSTGEGLLFLVDGKPFDSSRGTPIDLLQDEALVETWAGLDDTTAGELDTQRGPVRWLAVPVGHTEGTLGTFVVARFYEPELTEINAAVRVMATTSVVVLAVASVVGWLTVGTVIAPIRRITRTARRISDTDLSERIAVSGNDEVAELTITFNDMLDRLEEAFVDQRRFLDDIGHELRTPLTIVRGHLELLPDDPQERGQALALCMDEVDRMNRYVSELILLAKAEKPDFLRLGPVDLAELTHSMKARAVALAPERTWQIDHIAHAVIEADPDRLNQAWLNLVNNAAQHTGPGGLVALGSDVVDGQARLWVRDDGPGIPMDEQEQIFERFGRGGDGQTRRAEGTGLGLAIVAAIARSHGGQVLLESRPGQGARFTLVIPVSPDEGVVEL